MYFAGRRGQLSDLYFLKGNIYYRIDSFQRAVEAFSAGNTYEAGPKYLAARAGAYLKRKMPDSAFVDLIKAAEINYDYKWNLGNYYEVIGKRDSALINYTWLYNEDSVVYKFCKQRINELEKRHPKVLTELYTDRDRKVLLFK